MLTHEEEFTLVAVTVPTLLLTVVSWYAIAKDHKVIRALVALVGKLAKTNKTPPGRHERVGGTSDHRP